MEICCKNAALAALFDEFPVGRKLTLAFYGFISVADYTIQKISKGNAVFYVAKNNATGCAK